MAKKTSTSNAKGTQRALVIGVSDYPRPEDRLPAVAADVREMAKVLSSRHGTFPKSAITVLVDRQATRDEVLKSLQSALAATSAETVFIYLAGHGFENSGKYYYVAYDTTDVANAVSLAEIKTLFDQSASRRVFLWLDFCHSGGILARRGGSDDMAAIRRGIGVVSGHGKVIVAACTSAQQSYESASIGHGFFTHALLRGLRGEAKSAQGEVTAHSLYEFIDHQVANVRQQPVFFGETTGRIVLMHYESRNTNKKVTAGKKPSPSGPKKAVAKIKGTWVMLGDEFFVAERIRNHSDGSIELAITPQSGEQEAAIVALRPNQYGHTRDIPFAANNDAHQVRVEQVVGETLSGKQVWTVTLKAVQRQGSFMEMNVQGVGPDEIARRRIGRILLNDPPPRTAPRSAGYRDDDFVDAYISGSMTGIEVKECVVRSTYRLFGQSAHWRELARLKSIYLMKMTGTVEHILELKIGAVRGNKVSVSFRGRRPQQYSSVAPETIEVSGKCPLD